MARLRIFSNNVTDEDRRYYWEVHRTRPSDEQILKEKRGLANGIVAFLFLLGFFLYATGRPQWEWTAKHGVAASNLIHKECYEPWFNLPYEKQGLAAFDRDRCMERVYVEYRDKNIPEYWGWGKIRWRVKWWLSTPMKNRGPVENRRRGWDGMMQKKWLSFTALEVAFSSRRWSLMSWTSFTVTMNRS